MTGSVWLWHRRRTRKERVSLTPNQMCRTVHTIIDLKDTHLVTNHKQRSFMGLERLHKTWYKQPSLLCKGAQMHSGSYPKQLLVQQALTTTGWKFMNCGLEELREVWNPPKLEINNWSRKYTCWVTKFLWKAKVMPWAWARLRQIEVCKWNQIGFR